MALGLDKVSTKSAWRRNNKMSEIEQKVRKNKRNIPEKIECNRVAEILLYLCSEKMEQ